MINYDFEIEPTVEGYKIYCYNSRLAHQLNKIAGYPYGRVNFVKEGSEGIFRIPTRLWKKAQSKLKQYKRNLE